MYLDSSRVNYRSWLDFRVQILLTSNLKHKYCLCQIKVMLVLGRLRFPYPHTDFTNRLTVSPLKQDAIHRKQLLEFPEKRWNLRKWNFLFFRQYSWAMRKAKHTNITFHHFFLSDPFHFSGIISPTDDLLYAESGTGRNFREVLCHDPGLTFCRIPLASLIRTMMFSLAPHIDLIETAVLHTNRARLDTGEPSNLHKPSKRWRSLL